MDPDVDFGAAACWRQSDRPFAGAASSEKESKGNRIRDGNDGKISDGRDGGGTWNTVWTCVGARSAGSVVHQYKRNASAHTASVFFSEQCNYVRCDNWNLCCGMCYFRKMGRKTIIRTDTKGRVMCASGMFWKRKSCRGKKHGKREYAAGNTGKEPA